MKNKFRKNKLIGGIAMGLVATSLIGVGFATWVVAYQDKQETGDITVDVADVVNQTLTIKELKADDAIVIFDAEAGDDKGYIKANASKISLDFGITFNIEIADTSSFKGLSIAAYETVAKLSTWVTSNYIVSPVKFATAANAESLKNYVPLVQSDMLPGTDTTKTTYVDYGTDFATGNKVAAEKGDVTHSAVVAVTKAGTKYSFNIDFNFKWGTAFDSKNPSLKDSTEAEATASLDVLKNMKTEPIAFKLSLKHDPANAVTFTK